jgi:hypothetical protein
VIRGVLVLLALAALIAGEAAAQKDVADPLEHFLGTAPPGTDAKVTGGYAVDGFFVADLGRDALPDACPAGDAPEIERLDVGRYRANGLQAWIRR